MTGTVETVASVVICTRNRADMLARTLKGCLAACRRSRVDFELIVVDNASSDDTREVAAGMLGSAENLWLVSESEIGLSAARDAGVRKASGQFVVFLDDDAIPQDGWLESLMDGLARERVGGAGGPVEPVFEGELPSWFPGRFLPYLSVWNLGPEVRELSYNEYPRGANMAFLRTALEEAGGFSRHLGRRGRSLRSCEETELYLRLERLGWRILYLPMARVRHHVSVKRLTPEWMESRFASQGVSEAIVNFIHAGWSGLLDGLSLYGRNARAAASERHNLPDGRELYRCCRAALGGYLKGMAIAPVFVQRWPSSKPDATVRPWRPPH